MATLDLSSAPALKPPDGVESNFVNPESLIPILIDTTIICLCCTTFATVARLILKLRNIRSLRLEDYAAFTAWSKLNPYQGGFVAYNALQVLAADLGQGRHQWDVTLAGLNDLLLVLNIIEILYGPIIFVAKLTILLQFKKIFCPSKRGAIYWCIYVLIWTNLIFYFVDTFIIAFPGQLYSDRRVEHLFGPLDIDPPAVIHLEFENAYEKKGSNLSGLCDWAFVRYSPCLVFPEVADFDSACVSNIIRLAYSVQMAHAADTTYIIGKVGMWSCAEMTTVILAGSLPVLPNFFLLMREKLEFSKYPTRSGKSAHSQHHATVANYFTKRSNSRSIAPWLDPDDETWQLNDSYLPLEEPASTRAAATKVQITRGHEQHPIESRALRNPDVDLEGGLEEGIRKTVRIETSHP